MVEHPYDLTTTCNQSKETHIMATRESTQAAPAVIVSESAETSLSVRKFLHAAFQLLEEIEQNREQLIAVAMAGESVTSSDALTERCLFQVIQTVAESTVVTGMLRDQLKELGTSFGVSCVVQS